MWGMPIDQSAPAAVSADIDGADGVVPMSFPGARRIAGWLFWLAFPALAVAAITMGVMNIAKHIGDTPTGIHGTFVVDARHCSKGFCTFGGTFSSADGSQQNISALGDPRWHAGQVHQVVFNPLNLEVVDLPANWDAVPSVLAVVGGLTYLVGAGFALRSGRRDGEPDSARGLEDGGDALPAADAHGL